MVDSSLDRCGHGPKVNRDMGSLGEDPSITKEERTAKIQSLFDISAISRSTKSQAHFIRNGIEHMAKN